MVNGAPSPGTMSPQPRGFDTAATQVLSGLGPYGPVLYASGPAGPRSQRASGAATAGQPARPGHGCRIAAGTVAGDLELTALGQPRLRLKGQPGPAISFSQAAGCLWAALDAYRPGGRGRRPAVGV